MREEYEESGLNPLKVGIIGAAVVAILIAGVMQFRSYSASKTEMQQEQAALQDELTKAKKENKDLQKKLDEVREESKSTQARLERSLKLKESQMLNTAREKDSASRSAEQKIGQLNKEKSQLETQVEQMRKEAEQRAQEIKKAQEQVAKLQAELKATRADSERLARDVKTLQGKLNKVNEGDAAAAELIVQQLSEARQQLKREQAARQKLQQELDNLKQQTQANPQ